MNLSGCHCRNDFQYFSLNAPNKYKNELYEVYMTPIGFYGSDRLQTLQHSAKALASDVLLFCIMSSTAQVQRVKRMCERAKPTSVGKYGSSFSVLL